MNKIKSALNLSFAVFIIYVLACSKPVSSIQKEETVQPPPFLKKEKKSTGNDSLLFARWPVAASGIQRNQYEAYINT